MKKLLFFAPALPSRLMEAAWLLFRLHLGLSIAIGAGWSKLVNLTTTQELAKLTTQGSALGPPDWFVQQVAQLGFTQPSPYFWAALAAWGEFAGGLLIALGLLTRWSGVQLAIQFLVIAFLWYDAPEPLLGMYYQQLLFWAFVLVAAVGGGRYSLDYALGHSAAVRPLLQRLLPSRRLTAAAAVCLTLVSAIACWGGNLHSNLFIEPGKQFVLGGGQRGAFRVAAHNIGKVPVEFKERPAGGGIFGKATLAPGQKATLKFMAGSTAVLLNPSGQQANLDLTVTGDTNLRMDYESTGKP
ncbi:Uncharacterized membrane protein YphA, DoxX/SURF4 family [Hymenobacter gelipurpurascens]|uniref:Uncharacterized membrane protein YphA, DoxX/SURF4 family n=1 Tax=Hymenobacter gelipurpurascens TaxID=89968 RepID=A0A212TJ56_9BACT|nr:DoxX family protein [Hymenobacter gelipurpurascens]SNC65856.1 Uncharacterized membrane protein YphA, DoxX/SURF4 family [Hymenobacter gelipurpurascens]